jgi:plastocyanin
MDRTAIPGIVGRGMVIGVLALVVVACGSGVSAPTTGASGQTSVGQPTGTRVTAILTDFHIALSQQSFRPGPYTFTARNAGQVTHALEITGPGAPGTHATSNIAPGQSADLTVTLQAGSYEIICPVDGHKSLGMDVTITVGVAGNASTPAPATT